MAVRRIASLSWPLAAAAGGFALVVRDGFLWY
jgi:hypothetical protein